MQIKTFLSKRCISIAKKHKLFSSVEHFDVPIHVFSLSRKGHINPTLFLNTLGHWPLTEFSSIKSRVHGLGCTYIHCTVHCSQLIIFHDEKRTCVWFGGNFLDLVSRWGKCLTGPKKTWMFFFTKVKTLTCQHVPIYGLNVVNLRKYLEFASG